MSPPNGFQRPDPALIADLRARIARIERQTPESGGSPGALSLGSPELDAALPWGGLPRTVLHEVIAADWAANQTAAAGFGAALSARLAGGRGTVLWCRRRRDPWGRALYGPGLAAFGLASRQLIVARGRNETDVLWAMEEGLRSGAPAAVLGEVGNLVPGAARRLQLAAKAGGVTGLLLNGAGGAVAPGPAVTRWRVSAAAQAGAGASPRWWVELLRCRGGAGCAAPAAWFVEWRDGTTGRFAVVAAPGHRAPGPAPGGDVAGVAAGGG
ncbi:MAG: hypothetical protein QGI63_07675 [Rhodospirillales bacterium]|jgi:protein ImuA|nr:hypothetical protein [Rhodospirillales bacterium]MDP6774133.1 hypothetical protein [Rhodospirillales bacterium]